MITNAFNTKVICYGADGENKIIVAYLACPLKSAPP